MYPAIRQFGPVNPAQRSLPPATIAVVKELAARLQLRAK
jgi:hypothetical protein